MSGSRCDWFAGKLSSLNRNFTGSVNRNRDSVAADLRHSDDHIIANDQLFDSVPTSFSSVQRGSNCLSGIESKRHAANSRFRLKLGAFHLVQANSRGFDRKIFRLRKCFKYEGWFQINQQTLSLKELLGYRPMRIVRRERATETCQLPFSQPDENCGPIGTVVASVVQSMSRLSAGTHSNEGFDHGQRHWHH